MRKRIALTVVFAIACYYDHLTEARELHFLPSNSETLIQKAWLAYKAEYVKTYSNAAEEHLRRKIFYDSLNTIEIHNYLYETGRSTYKMGINHFADMNSSEFMQINRLEIDDVSRNRSEESFSFVDDGEMALEMDWRNKGYVTRVKNQGHCGSCWAFSATGSLEGQTKRRTGRLVSLSEQNLIDCSAAQGNHGCNGGLASKAFDYIKKNRGIDTEESYPYTAKDDACRYNAKYRGATVKDYVYLERGNEGALTKAIGAIGPISVSIDVTENFRLYKSGIFKDSKCQTRRLKHAVLAVGYGSKDAADYYIVKNSWGTTWGESGYIRIARNSGNMCGIATRPCYPLV